MEAYDHGEDKRPKYYQPSEGKVVDLQVEEENTPEKIEEQLHSEERYRLTCYSVSAS